MVNQVWFLYFICTNKRLWSSRQYSSQIENRRLIDHSQVFLSALGGSFFTPFHPTPPPSFSADFNQRERKWLFSIENVDIWWKNKGRGSERCTELLPTPPKKKKFTDNSFLSLPNAAQVWEWTELAVTFTKPEIPSLINSVKGLDGHINLFVCVWQQ